MKSIRSSYNAKIHLKNMGIDHLIIVEGKYVKKLEAGRFHAKEERKGVSGKHYKEYLPLNMINLFAFIYLFSFKGILSL